MKNLRLLFLFPLLACVLHAAPLPFTIAPLKVVLEPTAEHPFEADAAVTQEGRLVYQLQGQVFSGDAGQIAPATGKTDRATPWQTLAELLAAYAKGDVAAIRSLYTADSAAFFERIESKPELRARWLAGIQKMTTVKALFAYQEDNSVVAFVDASGGGALPFAFEKTGKQYLLSTKAGRAGSLFTNLSLALANFHMKPAEILRP